MKEHVLKEGQHAFNEKEYEVNDHAAPIYVALRTTNIYRREGDEWLLVHRQADPQVGAQAPESVVQ